MAAPKDPAERILIKLSGAALQDGGGKALSMSVMERICGEISDLCHRGKQVALVTGGGNIIRGIHSEKIGLNRITADYMGMLGTIINGLAIQDYLEKKGVTTRLYSALGMEEIAERHIKRNVVAELQGGKAIIFTAGTGHPFFSTDTTAALRAIEIEADLLLKATNVDGLYEDDPKVHQDVEKFTDISYNEVIQRELKAMDMTAITMCKEHDVPIRLFNINRPGYIGRAVAGEVGTIIHSTRQREDNHV